MSGALQWARWGREGEKFLDVVRNKHPQVLSDSFAKDGKVDEVTDLFGQVPFEEGAAGPFSARVRPDNLVFFDAAEKGIDKDVTLAPLAPPHPGCAAFYRDEEDPDRIVNAKLGVRGYKVYRVGEKNDKPWLFEAQGVYDVTGKLEKDHKKKVNKTCDLLRAGQKGFLRVAVRALSKREVTLLLATCAVDWRLGGGKPLGLGLCRVQSVDFVDEDGKKTRYLERKGKEIATLSSPYTDELAEDSQLIERMKLWQDSQKPVPRLRYPRAVSRNNNRIQRGGHVWFARHASQRKSSGSIGLEVLWTRDELETKVGSNRVRAQPLPILGDGEEHDGSLHGYDAIALDERKERDGRTYVAKMEPFDPAKHVHGNERSGGTRGPNRQSRTDTRGRR